MIISKNIVEIAPLQYGTIMSDGRDTKICDNYGQEYTIYNNENATDGNDLSVNSLSGASTQYNDIDSIYISRDDFVYSGKYSVQSSTYLSKYLQCSYLFSESSAEAVTGKYACGVQALFAKEKGYTDTEYKGIKYSPNISWIKDKLENNRPILMLYRIKVDGKRSGHFISILAYRKAKKYQVARPTIILWYIIVGTVSQRILIIRQLILWIIVPHTFG